MLLHELVRLRNCLSDIRSQISLKYEIINKSMLIYPITDCVEGYDSFKDKIKANFKLADDSINQNQELLTELVAEITTDINKLAHEQYGNLQAGELSSDWISDEALKSVLSRIYLTSSWQYPSCYINCKDTRILFNMVQSDPLYLIVDSTEQLYEAEINFNEVYRRRLRGYLYNQLDLLPKNQFSCIVCSDYFNYLNFRDIQHYLTQVIDLLRPGGSFIFTYNNCELDTSVRLVEEQTMSWNTKTQLVDFAKSLGYNITYAEDVPNQHNWQKHLSILEISKPGTLSTIKAHQVLGRPTQK